MKAQIKYIVELGAGFLFGLGLIVSGMSDPSKVLGFLDITGLWDPSLMFVMGGAIGVAIVPFYLINKNPKTWYNESIKLPNKTLINKPLIMGNALFGIGWGLAGICPGPAVVGLASGLPKAALFIVAMLAGTKAVQLASKK